MKKHLLLLVLGIYCINQINNVFAQRRDSIYYSNFIYHADGSQCKHTPPQTSFMFFINNNDNKILIENAPRWGIGDPNIKGNGIYGVELANFINPVVTIGDTVCARFICSAAQQQVISKEVINGFPWIRMPQFLTMSAVNIPSAPMNVKLFSDTLDMTCRTLTWTSNTGEKYRIYRRTDDDVTPFNEPRMLYSCIASDIIGGTFVDSTCQINKRYAYIIFAIVENNIVSHHSMEVIDPSPFEPGEDITIGYIARLPRINYIWGSSDPSYDGWPAEGSTVTWQATVKNWFGKTLKSVQYKWILDTTIVDTGSVDIPANSTTEINYQWKWVFDRHKLTLIIDPLNLIQEEEELNNNLTIFTNAISAGFYVEQRTYDYFHMYQKMLKVHSNCWEDWAQRHTSRWNQMFTNAIYPESPQGVLDRIRIDKITVVPDGALPLAGGSYPTNMPNLNDRTVDLQWGFTAEGVQGSFYSNHTSVSDNNPFYFEGSLLHELGHARYLIDVYGFNVHDDGTGNVIAVTENGRNVVQSSLVPRNYYTPMNGLMNGQYTYIDRYSAAAMNLIAGCRAVIGNYNAPGNIGIFMNDLPTENSLKIRDEIGTPLTGASVKVYRAAGMSGAWYGKYYDDTPDITLIADSSGKVLLGKCPFSATGNITHTYGYSNAVVLIRVAFGGKVGYNFLESYWFNLQYWNGKTTLGEYELGFKLLTNVGRTIADVPNEYELKQNFPNPFNPSTSIKYYVAQTSKVRLSVFDLLGKETVILVNTTLEPGSYTAHFDAKDLPSGIYLYRLQAGSYMITKKLIILR